MSDGLGRARAILAHQLNDEEHPAVRQEKLLLAIAESLADIADSLRDQPQYEWEIEFAKGQPDGVTCQIPDCSGHTNWGWCSVHTPLHYKELP